MKPDIAITPVRIAVLTLSLGLGGCSMLGIELGNDSIDYRSGAAKTPTLEVPPDLTPLARDGRYQPQAGAVSANALASGAAARPVAGPGEPSVAVLQAGNVHVERAGAQRWLVVPQQSPEQLWPKIRQFWLDRGFNIATESAEAGTLETDWAQNRAKLPQDLVRRTLGTVAQGLFDSGERDRYLTRLERGANGTEVYISHRGIEEQLLGRGGSADSTVWVARPSDPQLESEMLTRLMVSLGVKDEIARTEVAKTGDTVAPRARVLSTQPGAALQVDDTPDRAWRRVGLALDRGGFTVEERDRNQGLYRVRFIDTKEAAKDEPNFLVRWFKGDDQAAKALNRYRIQLKAEGNGTLVTVLDHQGQPDKSANAQKIVSLLADELKL